MTNHELYNHFMKHDTILVCESDLESDLDVFVRLAVNKSKGYFLIVVKDYISTI